MIEVYSVNRRGGMSNPQRLAFVTRHFNDLQTIRFVPVPVAMVLALAVRGVPRVSRGVAWGMLVGFLLCVGLFYWWSTVAIRRRYGSVNISREETQRMRRHPVTLTLFVILAATLTWFRFFAPHTHSSDLYISFFILILMLTTILDSTNPASRRIAWAMGLSIVVTAGIFLLDVDGGAAIFALAGSVWLALSIFDFLLLRRTFAEIHG